MSKQLTEMETALLKVSCDIITSADSGKCTALVLLDISLAFDTVDHDILVGKSFIVAVNHQRLKPADLAYGMPQGSILDPLLFLIYILLLGEII